MKVINLDKIVTKRDKVIILGGVEHAMHTPTVKDYIEQMKVAEQIGALGNDETDNLDTASRIFDLTITTLCKSFPTVKREQFEALSMEQLDALRGFAEDASEEDAGGNTEQGEAQGETE